MVVVIVKLFKIELKGYTPLWFGESVCGRTLLKLFSAFRGFSLLSFYTTITFVKAFFYFRSYVILIVFPCNTNTKIICIVNCQEVLDSLICSFESYIIISLRFGI